MVKRVNPYIEKGRIEGERQGEKKGEKKGEAKIIRRILSGGRTIEEVSEMLGLPVDEILAILKPEQMMDGHSRPEQ